jgi:hypothetical protein
VKVDGMRKGEFGSWKWEGGRRKKKKVRRFFEVGSRNAEGGKVNG